VVVSTHRRPQFLRELVGHLEDQTLPRADYEVVLVDNGSDDGPGGTWDTLCELVAASPLRAMATLCTTNAGPAGGRNHGAAKARGSALAFTDDDCLPRPDWLANLREAMDAGADLVQGRTIPDPRGTPTAGPWDRTVTIAAPTPFFETCNVLYRKPWFDELGGFDETDDVTATGDTRPFGEDAVLAARLVAAGGSTAFADGAIVHHRWFPGSFREHLVERRRLARFPGLVRRSPVLERTLVGGVFLSPSTAATDLAIAGVLLAAWRGRPLPLLLTVPWIRRRWPEVAGRRTSVAALRRAGAMAVADAVGAASLVEGSVRSRRLVL
jgi:glycosyltransferase involved in cell wall biosynthesis